MADEHGEGPDLPRITRDDNAQGSEHWLHRPHVTDAMRARLAPKAIIGIPREGFRDDSHLLFPVGTEELLCFMREHAPKDVEVDLAIEDDDYRELALHHDWLLLGMFIVSAFAMPVFVNLVSKYLERRIWPKGEKRERLGVKVRVIVEDQHGRRVGISYEGNVDEFAGAFDDTLDSLRGDGFEIPRVRVESDVLVEQEIHDGQLIADDVEHDE